MPILSSSASPSLILAAYTPPPLPPPPSALSRIHPSIPLPSSSATRPSPAVSHILSVFSVYSFCSSLLSIPAPPSRLRPLFLSNLSLRRHPRLSFSFSELNHPIHASLTKLTHLYYIHYLTYSIPGSLAPASQVALSVKDSRIGIGQQLDNIPWRTVRTGELSDKEARIPANHGESEAR